MITSVHNPKIKWVRDLQASSRQRRDEGVFIVEGVRLAEEALAAGWIARLALYTSDLNERAQAVVDSFAAQGAPVEVVAPAVLQAASDTAAPQGVLVVLEAHALPIPEPLTFALIPDQLRDPGNLGTLLRTAAAAGVQAVFCPPGTVDVFSPKVVRAGMGAHFRLPALSLGWAEIVQRCAGLQVYLAAAGEGCRYDQVDFTRPLALLVGGEAEGAGPEARQLSTARVHIPMPGGSESLNVAVAAAVLLFEAARQRAA